MKVVIDTNCFLVSISSFSKYHWLFDELVQGKFQLFVTTEILTEYEEIIGKYFSRKVYEPIFEFLVSSENVLKIEIFYHLDLIKNDPDDNKFVDCAFAGNADFIITNDKHFAILREVPFPKLHTLSIEEYKKVQTA